MTAMGRQQREDEAMAVLHDIVDQRFFAPASCVLKHNGHLTVRVFLQTRAAPNVQSTEREIANQLQVSKPNFVETFF